MPLNIDDMTIDQLVQTGATLMNVALAAAIIALILRVVNLKQKTALVRRSFKLALGVAILAFVAAFFYYALGYLRTDC